MGFVQSIIEFVRSQFLKLWPIARVYSYQRGVRVRRGKLGNELQPGLHWRIPFLDEIWRTNVTERVIDLREGSVTTTDRKAIVISGNLSYRVKSPKQMWLTVQDFDTSLSNLALGVMCSAVSVRSWEALQAERATLEHELEAKIQAVIQDWGVELVSLHLTDLVESRHYRMFNQSYAYTPATPNTPLNAVPTA